MQRRGSRQQPLSSIVMLNLQSALFPPLPLSLRPVSLVFGYALPRSSALNSPRNASRVAASSNYGHSNCNQILGLPINHLWLLDIIASSVQRVHVPPCLPPPLLSPAATRSLLRALCETCFRCKLCYRARQSMTDCICQIQL